MLLEGQTILAIDDAPSILTFLRVSLLDEGATFHAASTAKEGLRLCHEVHPDIVILDLGLPDADGLDILPEIKNLSAQEPPCTIVLTVRKGNETIQEAYQKGADGYLTKPFMVEDLLEIIEEKKNKRQKEKPPTR